MRKEPGQLSQREKNDVVERHREQIRHHSASLAEVQAEFKDAIGDHPLLVIDNSLDVPARRVSERMDKLRAEGWGKLVALYVEHLFGGRVPHSAEDTFRRFFGEELNLQFFDIRKGAQRHIESPQAMIFSGSPISIVESLHDAESEVDEAFTHRELWRRTVQLYREAERAHIPVVGICYGHQMIAHQRGGEIEEMSKSKKGLVSVEAASSYAHELLMGVVGDSVKQKGKVMIGHEESVRGYRPERSALLFRTSDQEKIIHGLLHIADSSLSGDARLDAELVNGLLADGRHLAMGVQGHPEADAVRNILFELAINEDELSDTEDVLTATILRCMTNFLKNHKRLKI